MARPLLSVACLAVYIAVAPATPCCENDSCVFEGLNDVSLLQVGLDVKPLPLEANAKPRQSVNNARVSTEQLLQIMLSKRAVGRRFGISPLFLACTVSLGFVLAGILSADVRGGRAAGDLLKQAQKHEPEHEPASTCCSDCAETSKHKEPAKFVESSKCAEPAPVAEPAKPMEPKAPARRFLPGWLPWRRKSQLQESSSNAAPQPAAQPAGNISDMDLDGQFLAAQYALKAPMEAGQLTNENKLSLYAHFKQATVGDVQGSQPGRFDLKARYKWDFWAALKGMPAASAKQEYCKLVDDLVPGWREGASPAPEKQAPAKAEQNIQQAEEFSRPALQTVLFFVLGHCVCATSLTVVNKWALNVFHPLIPPLHPPNGHGGGYLWTLVVIQFLFAAAVARAVGAMGFAKVDALEWQKASAFFPAAAMFMITIVAANAVMDYSNVNTFLVLRSLVPIPAGLIEVWCYKDPAPPTSSWLALGITVAGATAYAQAVGGMAMRCAGWALMYLVLMPIDSVLVKHYLSASKLSAWGMVYYNNVLAVIPAIFFMLVFELPSGQRVDEITSALAAPGVYVPVFMSCVLGLGISYFSLGARYYISAVGFMVLGVVDKFGTVFVNSILFDGQGKFAIACVCTTLLGAILWQQTMRLEIVKVRSSVGLPDKKPMLPFYCACAAIVWAMYIQWASGERHS